MALVDSYRTGLRHERIELSFMEKGLMQMCYKVAITGRLPET
jgi:hypothetical protein